MDRATALRRLRACLRLSKSANVHEAAAALRQAQALMAEYQLSEKDADPDAVCTRSARTRSRNRLPPVYISMLATLCGDVFECTDEYAFYGRSRVEIEFTGKVANAEIAAYSFTVLRRQLEADIAKATKRYRKRSNKAKYADLFGMGWVTTVRAKIVPPAPAPPPAPPSNGNEMTAEQNASEKRGAKARQWSRKESEAFWKGMEFGGAAELHSGMRAEKRALEKL